MMSKRNLSFTLLATVAGALVVGAAACSGGGGGGSATPTPSATPLAPNECDVVFETDNSASNIDLYAALMPASTWSNGTKTIAINSGDPGVDATYTEFIKGLDPTSTTTPKTRQLSGAATNGSFTLSGIPTTGATAMGAAFGWAGTSLQFYDELGSTATRAYVASNGAGSIATGTLSDPATGANITPLVGHVTIGINSATIHTVMVVGSGANGAAYAVCYNNTAFAPMSLEQRAIFAFERAHAARQN